MAACDGVVMLVAVLDGGNWCCSMLLLVADCGVLLLVVVGFCVVVVTGCELCQYWPLCGVCCDSVGWWLCGMCCAGCAEVLVFVVFGVDGCGEVFNDSRSVATGVSGCVVVVGVGGRWMSGSAESTGSCWVGLVLLLFSVVSAAVWRASSAVASPSGVVGGGSEELCRLLNRLGWVMRKSLV